MKKIIYFSGIFIFLGFFSLRVLAQSLSADMQQLNHLYAILNTSEDRQEVLQALVQMLEDSRSAQQKLPHALHGLSADDRQVLAYQATYEPLIKSLEQARDLLEAGQLAQAQHLFEQIEVIKKQGHRQFK